MRFSESRCSRSAPRSLLPPSGPILVLRIMGPGDAVDNRPVILTLTLRYLAASETNTWDYILEMVKLCVVEDGDLLTLDNGPVQVSGAPTAGTYVSTT